MRHSWVLRRSGGGREPGQPPLGEADLEPSGPAASLLQLRDRFGGKHAVRTAAVRDDLDVSDSSSSRSPSSSSGTEIAPAMWPASYSLVGRTSTTTTSSPASIRR
jgi:hypothetical protein